MNTAPITPARLGYTEEGLPCAPDFDDVYHPQADAFAQARHVFLRGNGLPERWQRRERFVILETGFGLGNNFLASWQAWRDDPLRSCQLHFISIERHPLIHPDMQRAHAQSPAPELAAQLLAAWPPLTANLHRLSFDEGRVQLLLAFGDVQQWLPELQAEVDAFYLDGFAPAKNPQMWEPRLFKAIGRMAAPEATAATWSSARAVRDGLGAAGFEAHREAGTGGKRDITLARYAPAFTPRRAPALRSRRRIDTAPNGNGSERHALIVGAGLAGCAAAWALAEQGWSSMLIDRHTGPAQEASGNPAGLFHGIVNGQDGTHARFNRAAALEAQRFIQAALAGAASGEGMTALQGAVQGLLRLETTRARDTTAMQAVVQHLGLPPDYVQALSAEQASALSGLPLSHPAWFYPGGGWVQPAGLARAYLRRAASCLGQPVAWRGGLSVDRLTPTEAGWQLRDAHGAVFAEAGTVVLANAGDALRLLAADAPEGLNWRVEATRGQLSWIDRAWWEERSSQGLEERAVGPRAQRMAEGLRGLDDADRSPARPRLQPAPGFPQLPSLPIAGAGYLLPEVRGLAVFGASSDAGDFDAQVREADHAANLERVAQLTGQPWPFTPNELSGRVAWRWSAADRLPIVGGVPDLNAATIGRPIDQPRFMPRRPGLFVCTAFGSRGITWSALAAQALAAQVTGAPSPIEASLVDAIDPARFLTRAVRRQTSQTAAAEHD